MTWQEPYEANGSNIWQQNIKQILEQTQAVLPPYQGTHGSTQPIFEIYLGRPRASIQQDETADTLKILTDTTGLLKSAKPMAATLLV